MGNADVIRFAGKLGLCCFESNWIFWNNLNKDSISDLSFNVSQSGQRVINSRNKGDVGVRARTQTVKLWVEKQNKTSG